MSVRRFTSSVLVWLCLSSGVGLLCGAPAFAAAPEAPTVEVWGRNSTEVTLRGVLYPNNTGEPGSYEFLYKQSTTECTGEGKTTAGVASGNQFEEVYEALSGLQSGKPYTICLAVTSPEGTTLSSPVTVTTAIRPETPEGLKAESVAAFTATLKGTLNPAAERKAEPGSYEFLYRKSATECEGEGQTPSTTAAGERAEAVSAPITELLAHTTYTFCLRQSNEIGEVATSQPVTFTTLAAAPEIEGTGATYVTAESATFTAKINPEGAETTYTVEYARKGAAFVPVPQGEGATGEGPVGVQIGAHLQGLTAHTSYEFRVTVTNALDTVTSVPIAFTTQASGESFALPDQRTWEMVSPPQKEGTQLGWIQEGIIQASASGNAISDWTLWEPIEEKAEGAYNVAETNFFGRGPDGWHSKTITPPHSAAGTIAIGNGLEYHMFSEDLSKAILQPLGPATPLVQGVSESTPYLRTDYLNGNSGEICTTECFLPLVSAADTPAGTKYGNEPEGKCKADFCGPKVVGASPDLSQVVLSSQVQLTTTSTEGQSGLYEWSAGELRLINLLPVGETNQQGGRVAASAALGEGDDNARHAISNDGSRIVWVGGDNSNHLYLSDTGNGETIRLDAPNAGVAPPSGGGQPLFMTASSDDLRVFFLDSQRLTGDSTAKEEYPEEPDLYEFNLNAVGGHQLTDLTVDGNSSESADVQMVTGASDDGSYVYFTAAGALAAGAKHGVCGGLYGEGPELCNLYMRHDGTTRLIAALSPTDFPDWAKALAGLTSRVSPNGRWLTFMSNRNLTGYDNTDAVSGQADEEVYLYHTPENVATETGSLICASCNPTGARPAGVKYNSTTQIVAAEGVFNTNEWIAANVPPWTRMDASETRYQSRYLSNSGRLFFDSHDELVPQAVNGTQNVYEYEPASVGSCTAASSTFSERSAGCVSLISAGTSNEESTFLDASETGGDVFFLTTSQLVSQDFDNAYDIYDARECVPASRCVALPPVSPPACTSGDSCKAAPSPQPAIFGSPASSTFSGAGNAIPPGAKRRAQPRALTGAQKLARALRACHKKRKRRLRAACERKARVHYAAKKSRKANATKRGGR